VPFVASGWPWPMARLVHVQLSDVVGRGALRGTCTAVAVLVGPGDHKTVAVHAADVVPVRDAPGSGGERLGTFALLQTHAAARVDSWLGIIVLVLDVPWRGELVAEQRRYLHGNVRPPLAAVPLPPYRLHLKELSQRMAGVPLGRAKVGSSSWYACLLPPVPVGCAVMHARLASPTGETDAGVGGAGCGDDAASAHGADWHDASVAPVSMGVVGTALPVVWAAIHDASHRWGSPDHGAAVVRGSRHLLTSAQAVASVRVFPLNVGAPLRVPVRAPAAAGLHRTPQPHADAAARWVAATVSRRMAAATARGAAGQASPGGEDEMTGTAIDSVGHKRARPGDAGDSVRPRVVPLLEVEAVGTSGPQARHAPPLPTWVPAPAQLPHAADRLPHSDPAASPMFQAGLLHIPLPRCVGEVEAERLAKWLSTPGTKPARASTAPSARRAEKHARATLHISCVPRAHEFKWVHSRTGRPIAAHEDDVDSDVEPDSDGHRWLASLQQRQLSSFGDVAPPTRQFMSLWASFVAVHPVLQHRDVFDRCLQFADAHGDAVGAPSAPLHASLLAHVTLLWHSGVLAADQCLVVLARARAAADARRRTVPAAPVTGIEDLVAE